MELERISAILTTLNCISGLEDCIRIATQALNEGYISEIVVCDGGSNDGTWELLESIAETTTNLKIFQSFGANISSGRNQAIRRAEHSIILSIDSGCSVDIDYFRRFSEAFRGDLDLDVASGFTVAYGENPFEDAVAELQRGWKKELSGNPSSRSIAFKRAVFDAVDGYDETVMAGEDTHFNEKWGRLNFKYKHLPEARIYWRVRPNPISLYRMNLRNSTGSAYLRTSWTFIQTLQLLSVVLLLLSCLSLLPGIPFSGFGYLCIACWVLYAGSRMFRKGRLKYFRDPVRIFLGCIVIISLDCGFAVGSLKGWSLLARDKFS